MLNWLCRYALATAVVLDDDRELSTSLLDVGSGPHGFACAKPNAPFVGMDMAFPLPAAPSMLAVRNSPGRMPFADASFDTVISLDVLEHVPPGERSAFVAEMARVAARRVVVACPSSEMAAIDDLVRTTFLRSGLPVPGWLSEHDEFGLPTPAEIAEHCTPPEGFSSRPLRVPNGLFSTMASLADFVPETAAHAVVEATENSSRWIELFESAAFGDSWRKAYVLERTELATPLVEFAALEETALTALRCPRCAAAHERLGPSLLRCVACGRLAPRDTMNAWDVRTEARSLWCEPAWQPEALAPLLHGFADLDDPKASLVLHARPGAIATEEALACAGLALSGRALPDHIDVAISADPMTAEQQETAIFVDASIFGLFSPVS